MLLRMGWKKFHSNIKVSTFFFIYLFIKLYKSRERERIPNTSNQLYEFYHEFEKLNKEANQSINNKASINIT